MPDLDTTIIKLAREAGLVSDEQARSIVALCEKTTRASSSDLASAPEEVRNAAGESARTFGKFVRIELVGRGGWGEVWKAWETGLGRFVAIKTLTGSVAPEDRERFLREAQMAAKLAHPNIVAIHEQGNIDGVDYISMHFVAGQSLSKLRLPLREGLAVIRDAARAVDAAHQSGLVHRDLKPANIMVEGKTGRPYVLDFGLARSVREGASLSVSGTIMGTPAYMSPEQAEGHVHVDARADVYGLGATLYEVVTGQPPFAGEGILDVLRKVQFEEPLSPRRLNPRLDAEVETLIQKAMEKEAPRRYTSANEFAEDIDRFLRGDPIEARAASAAFRLYKRIKKQPVSWALGALLFMAVIGGTAFGANRFAKQLEAERTARLRAEDAMRAKEMAAAVDRVLALMGEVERITYDPKVSFAKIEPRAREMLREAEKSLAQFPDEAKLWYYKGKADEYLGNEIGARRDFTEAIRRDPKEGRSFFERGMLYMERFHESQLWVSDEERVIKVDEGLRVWLPKAMEDFGRVSGEETVLGQLWELYARGDHRKVVEQATTRIEEGGRIESFLYVRAQARMQLGDDEGSSTDLEATLERHPGHWRARFARAARNERHHRTEDALRDYDKVLEINPNSDEVRVNRGYVLSDLRRPEEALEDFGKALAINPKSVAALVGQGNANMNLRRFDEALSDFDRALEINPHLWAAAGGRGSVFLDQGKYDEALAEYRRAIEMNPKYADGYYNCGNAYLRSQRYEEALPEYEKALAINSKIGLARINRGLALKALGRIDEALAEYDRALSIDAGDALAYYNRGLAYQDLGQFDRALADYGKALELNPVDVNAYINRGNVYGTLRRYDEALLDYGKALAICPDEPNIFYNRGAILQARKRYAEAIADWKRAIQLRPDFEPTLRPQILDCEEKLKNPVDY